VTDADSPTSADALTEVLRTIRLQASTFFRSELSSPWGMTLFMSHEPRFHIVVEGSAWLSLLDHDMPVRLDRGDIAVIPNGAAHWIADDPETERVLSDEATEALEAGAPLFQGTTVHCRLICGLFHFELDEPHPLMATLQEPLIWKARSAAQDAWVEHLIQALYDELGSDRPGAVAIADRYCEVLLVHLLRHHRDLAGTPSGFFRGLQAPTISKALNAFHAAPQKEWTLQTLSRIAGVSRSVFAERFRELVGVTPMSYVTTWRMQKARGLLMYRDVPIKEVAEQVGYSSTASFSRAYKRVFGATPGTLQSGK
jgi:AraC-like DNA-binding protein